MKKFLASAVLFALIAAPTFVAAYDHKAAPSSVTGCLNGPTEDGTFVLKRVRAKDVQVGGLEDLQDHVGQQVRLFGSWVKSGDQIGEKEDASAKVGNKLGLRKHFRAIDIDKVSDSCDVTR